MKYLILFFYLFLHIALFSQKNIEINVKEKQAIDFSQIAETAKPIWIEENDEFKLSEIGSSVLVAENYVFVSKNITINQIANCFGLLQFDLNGKFIREIKMKDESSGKLLDLIDCYYLKKEKLICVHYFDKFVLYNLTGVVKRVIPIKKINPWSVYSTHYYQNHLWYISYSDDFNKGIVYYELKSMDLSNNKTTIVYSFERKMNQSARELKDSSADHGTYSFTDQGLIISVFDLILKVDKFCTVTPLYKITYVNDVSNPFSYRYFVYPARFCYNNWIFFGYYTSFVGRGAMFCYNIKSKKNYNVPSFSTQQAGEFYKINDDILGTGDIFLSGGSNCDYCYFFKSDKDVSCSVKRLSNTKRKLLVIVKLKD